MIFLYESVSEGISKASGGAERASEFQGSQRNLASERLLRELGGPQEELTEL